MGNALRFTHMHFTSQEQVSSEAELWCYTHLEWVFRERTGAINDLNTVIL